MASGNFGLKQIGDSLPIVERNKEYVLTRDANNEVAAIEPSVTRLQVIFSAYNAALRGTTTTEFEGAVRDYLVYVLNDTVYYRILFRAGIGSTTSANAGEQIRIDNPNTGTLIDLLPGSTTRSHLYRSTKGS